jgi:hypothetical protein
VSDCPIHFIHPLVRFNIDQGSVNVEEDGSEVHQNVRKVIFVKKNPIGFVPPKE